MNKIRYTLFSCLFAAFLITESVSAQNPVVNEVFTADPAAMVYMDTVYLYTGHDEATSNSSFYIMNNWHCFTTTNMVDYTSRGEVFSVADVSWASGDAWAGEVEERNGKFYFYFCAEHKNIEGKAVGVAVSDSPYGPFEDIGQALITNDMTEFTSTWDDIDPTVYIDTDGQAYMYWGNSQCYYVKLKENMTEIMGEIVAIDLPSFTEAPYIHKYGETFYLSYAYEWPEKIAYATSSSIEGPWVFQSVINDHVSNCGTNHQSIIEYKGQSYFIYHTGDIGGDYQRAVALDYLYYNADGTIKEIVQTRTGVELLDGTCFPTPIEPKAKLNGGDNTSERKFILNQGDNIVLSPEVTGEDGLWSWAGPRDFISSDNEIILNDVKPEQSGLYQAVFTNTCGVKSYMTYHLNISYGLPDGIESGKSYLIESINSALAMSVENGANENGSNIKLTSDNQLSHQRFILTFVEEVYWKMAPANIPSRSLDVLNISTDDGANIVLWDYWGGHGQQWEIAEKSINTYSIISRNSNKCLDVDSDNNIRQWTCNDSDDQLFQISMNEDHVGIKSDLIHKEIIIQNNQTDSNIVIDITQFSKPTELMVVDMNGAVLYNTKALEKGLVHLNMKLQSGLYIVKLFDNKLEYTKKIIIE